MTDSARESKKWASNQMMQAGLAHLVQEWLDLNDLVVCRIDEELDRDNYPKYVYTEIELKDMYPEVTQ